METISDSNSAKRRQVWNQGGLPVILRRDGKGELLRLRLPYAEDNRQWLRNGRIRRPKWSDDLSCWEIPKAWFNDFVDRSLQRFGAVYVIQPYREQEKCAPACLNATGHECQCACMGANHGAGNDGSWFEVTDTFACRWRGRELACRLMVARQ
ncbi:hypothetical protein B7H23_12950 [Notoacmeibacter marinus]|uniref:Uncharacterized protein n=1 Tax=Notoacmeibacter marinus TaxID=1876515 RepID=A0A231UT41_9HYPH|nr:hypothetical protein B7H23_12950 [Notoacmeibacter marinus]